MEWLLCGILSVKNLNEKSRECQNQDNSAQTLLLCYKSPFVSQFQVNKSLEQGGARWLSGRVSDSGARGPGFETYLRRVVSLSKTLYSPKVLVNYPGSDGSIPT